MADSLVTNAVIVHYLISIFNADETHRTEPTTDTSKKFNVHHGFHVFVADVGCCTSVAKELHCPVTELGYSTRRQDSHHMQNASNLHIHCSRMCSLRHR